MTSISDRATVSKYYEINNYLKYTVHIPIQWIVYNIILLFSYISYWYLYILKSIITEQSFLWS